MVSVFSLSVFSVFSLVKVKSVEFIIESFNCQLSIVNSLGATPRARALLVCGEIFATNLLLL